MMEVLPSYEEIRGEIERAEKCVRFVLLSVFLRFSLKEENLKALLVDLNPGVSVEVDGKHFTGRAFIFSLIEEYSFQGIYLPPIDLVHY